MSKNEENANANKRFIGKLRERTGANGDYIVLLVDNPNPEKADGSADPYYKGNLIWFDQETGLYYKVKQVALRNPSEKGAEHGDINSLMIDLDNAYHVDEME